MNVVNNLPVIASLYTRVNNGFCTKSEIFSVICDGNYLTDAIKPIPLKDRGNRVPLE